MYETNKTPDPAIVKIHNDHKQILSAMDSERSSWFTHWREISDYFLPRRYPTLNSKKENTSANRKNTKLLNSTSTVALRVLASGMMNGITSPSRPWFGLKIEGKDLDAMSRDTRIWLDDSTRRMQLVLAQSNFYTSIALLYLEWCGFGTASMAVEEDFDDVIRCYNYPLGEFYISQDNSQRINRHARRFMLTIEQAAAEFGEENLCVNSRQLFKKGGGNLLTEIEIICIIEPNKADALSKLNTPFREVFFELNAPVGKYLAVRPIYEQKTITPRWELLGNDSYGTSPCMDALADVISLQQLIMERAQSIAKMNRPPLIVDQALRNRPKALGAGGITYAANMSTNFGAKPAYQVQPPLQEMAMDIRDLVNMIRETLHNPLFNMISQLDTVRSATEIDARREEKLIHLGPVLERFYDEGLNPILKRVFGIMQRNDLFLPPPEELADVSIDVEFVSILTDAQRASGTIAIERYLSFAGTTAGVWPAAKEVPNVEELMRQYAEGIGIKPDGLNSPDEVRARTENEQQRMAMAEEAAVGKDLASGAKVLSETDVGGGMNALQQLM